jgi:hypothetical protein
MHKVSDSPRSAKASRGPERSCANEGRRNLLITSGVGAVLAASTGVAIGGDQARTRSRTFSSADRAQLDRAAVADLVVRERGARDNGMWAEMAACYHPNSIIEVSWFKGDGATFVEQTKKNLSAGRLSLHHMSPAIVTIRHSHALAENACQLTAFVELENIPVCIVNHARLLWRAQLLGDQWLIAGLRIIYIRDLLVPVNPNNVPKIDETEAARYRLSYRYLSYFFARSEHPAKDDLPGVDRPESVAALREGEKKWLDEA